MRAEIAASLGAKSLLIVTESGGLSRSGEGGDVVAECDSETYSRGLDEGWITGGMRVKLFVSFEALRAGVDSVYVVGPAGLVDRSTGTRIVPGGVEV